jgi:HAD superfamily hydrolase (TIGR01490 family)
MSAVRAALFDMDRTLVKKDTAALYMRYRREIGEARWRDVAQVAWWAFQYSLGVIDAPRVAARALAGFRGVLERDIVLSTEGWFRDYVVPHISDTARATVARHRVAGDRVAIVTGATRYAAQPLARELGIDIVISTELEVDASGRFTGRWDDPLCYGEGKIVRTERVAGKYGFTLEDAWFYSDSITDLPLLERVEFPIAVNPDRRLSWVARRRGWSIEKW